MTTKTAETKRFRYGLWVRGLWFSGLSLAGLSLALMVCLVPSAWAGVYQHGTVVRMRMTDCLPAHHGFMMAMSGPAAQMGPEVCPEYTLLSDKVVFVIVGRSSDQLIPLADVIDFRLHNNEMSVRVDDARKENKFGIKEMILRTEWDMVQKHITEEMGRAPHSPEDSPVLPRPE